jgi:hypothetical protein
MYVDTFAHQNFVGFEDNFNEMEGLLERVIPNIGHAKAMHNPDMPALIWKDGRLVSSHSEVDNKKRFLEATRCIYDKYAAYLHSSNDNQDLIAAIDKAIGEYGGNVDDRIERYKALIGNEYIEYDDREWFNNAVDFVIDEIPYTAGEDTVPKSETKRVWRGSYKNSHWYKFQEAVKTHQWLAMDTIIGPIFAQMEFKGL